MNGRIKHSETAEERLAAVAHSLVLKMAEEYRKTGCGPTGPDYADYRDELRPYIRREFLLVRIDEARKTHSAQLTGRIRELAAELAECEREIPQEHRL
jgi:hypothetical protein